MIEKLNLTLPSEVDKASQLNSHDPTGGRNSNGETGTKLSGNEMEDILGVQQSD
jgi:hypothetical protein